jgi:hypothetical protein
MATEDYYRPQDYTQEGINHGQRQINYALTQADRALINVLTIIKDALEAPPGRADVFVSQIKTAVDAATEAVNHVAGIRPPGCDSTWEPKSGPPQS